MFWLFCSVIAVALSPIGRAISDRMAGRRPVSNVDAEEIRWLEQRTAERIHELEDRIETAERFLRNAGSQ